MDNLFFVIKTNQYTGNFERELMAYVFGIVDSGAEEVVEEEFGCFEQETEEDIDFTDELSINYEACRFGREYQEYYGYYIDKYPEENKCNSIYIAINNKFSDRTLQKIKNRLYEFIKRVNGLEIISLDYYKSVFVKIE